MLGCFDHPGAARGTGVLAPGDVLLSCGTSWVGLYPSADRGGAVARGHLVDPFLAPAGPWGCMFALTAISVIIEKYIDRFLLAPGEEPARKYAIFNELAARVPPGAGGLRLDLYRDWSDFLKEVRDPLDGHPREHLARALMEGAAFVTRRKLEELDHAGIADRRLVMVGGPAESPVWPRIVAEVAGHELVLLHGQNAGAVGAAMLAAIGAGLYRDEREAFAAMGGEAVRIAPDPAAVRRSTRTLSMNKHELRSIRLLEMLHSSKRLGVKSVARSLAISEATARRFFSQLEEEGKVIRVHGGVQLAPQLGNDYSFRVSAAHHQRQKQLIGARAAELVRDNERIFLDSGTTVLKLAETLSLRIQTGVLKNLVVLTNSVTHLETLARWCKVILIGGEIRVERLRRVRLPGGDESGAVPREQGLPGRGRGEPERGLHDHRRAHLQDEPVRGGARRPRLRAGGLQQVRQKLVRAVRRLRPGGDGVHRRGPGEREPWRPSPRRGPASRR